MHALDALQFKTRGGIGDCRCKAVQADLASLAPPVERSAIGCLRLELGRWSGRGFSPRARRNPLACDCGGGSPTRVEMEGFFVRFDREASCSPSVQAALEEFGS